MMDNTCPMLTRRPLPLALVLLAVVLVYANSFGNSFHFDDFHAVTENPAVRSLRNLPRIFRDATAFSVLPSNQTYRPLVTGSLAFDYALGHGYNVFWFHLSTLVWFLLLLVVLALWAAWIFEATRPAPVNRWLALGVAAWFGVHPAMAETVNYVIQRGDLYCTLGCLLALWLYAAYPRWRRFGVYLVPFVCAMLSKPPAAVFPVLLCLFVFFFERTERPAPLRWRSAVMAALPATLLAVLLLWLQAARTPRSYAPTMLSASAYRLVQPYVWLRYATTLFFPFHLNVDTDLQPITTMNAEALAGLLFVAALLALTVFCARRRSMYPVAFGLLWFLVTQLPTSLYALSEVENDHRMFFSFPGLMLAVVWGGYRLVLRLQPRQTASAHRLLSRTVTACCVVALCGYAYGAHQRNRLWHDEASLWADDVAKSPHNGRGLMNYGLVKMGAGDFAGARDLFNRALLYTPNYPSLEINLGIVNGLLADAGQPALNAVAEQHFLRAMALAPADDAPHAYYGRWLMSRGRLADARAQLQTAEALNGQREMPRDLLLDVLLQLGDGTAAHALAEQTLALMPDDAVARRIARGNEAGMQRSPAVADLINASLADYRAGRFQQAIAEAQRALTLDPASAEAWNNVGAGYGAMRAWDLGIAAEQQALRLNPHLSIADNNLRWFSAQKALGSTPLTAAQAKAVKDSINRSLALNQAGDYSGSLLAAREAIRLDPASAEAWNNVAADDEALGRWDQAIAAAQRAIALRPDFQLARNNLAWSQQQKAKELR